MLLLDFLNVDFNHLDELDEFDLNRWYCCTWPLLYLTSIDIFVVLDLVVIDLCRRVFCCHIWFLSMRLLYLTLLRLTSVGVILTVIFYT